MVPSYGPFETKQLLSETFFSPGFDFRDIRLDELKWANLYIYIYIYICMYVYVYLCVIGLANKSVWIFTYK